MFSYYGTKRSIAHLYPKPRCNTIIEPFAGAAAYSLRHGFDRDVRLFDIDARIVTAWRYLIGATPEDILSLPILFPGDRLDRWPSLGQGASTFLGYMISASTRNPKKTATAKTNWSLARQQECSQLVLKIKHWRVEVSDFRRIRHLGEPATWFVDPPYQVAGKWYDHKLNPGDYLSLRDHCTSYWKGQVIACDLSDADWLPFQPLTKLKGQSNNVSQEGIYHRSDVPDPGFPKKGDLTF